MGVLILVHEPGVFADVINASVSQAGIEELEAIARNPEHQSPYVGGDSTKGVIETYYDVTVPLDEL